MRIDVTKQTFVAIMVQFLLFASVFLYCCVSRSGPPAFGEAGIYLLGDHINRFCASHPYLCLGISILLIFINAFVITRTVSRNLVYATRTYLPCLFYLLISCGIFFPGYDLAAILAAYLIVRATVLFISSFVRTVSFGTTFRAAFMIGLTPLLEPQNAIYILLVPVAAAVFRRCGREIFVATLGALIPALGAAYIFWIMGYDFTGLYKGIWEGLILPGSHPLPVGTGTGDIVVLAAAGFTALILLLSAFTVIFSRTDMRTRAYKILVFSLWFLFIAGISMALPSRSAGNLAVLAIPASILAPAFFIRFRGTVSLVFYILMCICVLAANAAFFLL